MGLNICNGPAAEWAKLRAEMRDPAKVGRLATTGNVDLEATSRPSESNPTASFAQGRAAVSMVQTSEIKSLEPAQPIEVA